jgi:N-acetylmuramoyl-L-alanine amidase
MKYLISFILAATAYLAFADNSLNLTEEEYCLALNIYHEARSENLAGMYAVSDVVLNRVDDNRYPNTVCGVVYDAVYSKWWLEERGRKVPVRNRCQFSWYCDGKSDDPADEDAWYQSQLVASHILNKNLYRGITEGATHYHATYVDPSWRHRFASTGRIGSHIFYRAD